MFLYLLGIVFVQFEVANLAFSGVLFTFLPEEFFEFRKIQLVDLVEREVAIFFDISEPIQCFLVNVFVDCSLAESFVDFLSCLDDIPLFSVTTVVIRGRDDVDVSSHLISVA